MSFITRSSFRVASRATFAPRAFSTSFAAQRNASEAVKDTLKAADRAVSDKIVDGIDVSQNVAQKVKEVAGMSTSEAEGKADELAGAAKGKANELTGQAKGKASELAGKAKGKKEEVKSNI